MQPIIRLMMTWLILAWPISAVSQRAALVIGNGNYRGVAALQNPPRDARAIGDALRQLGFSVEVLVDADRAAMLEATRRLAASNGAEVAMLFYAGHAIEVRGRNMLLPDGISPTAAAIDREALAYSEIEGLLEGRASATIIMLDACRDSPFAAEPERQARGRSGGRGLPPDRQQASAGLAATSSASGMLVAFATAPGRVALDGSGQNSPFTTALLQHLQTPDLEVRQMLGRVRRAVREATGGHQIPWDNSSLEGEFFFRSSVPVPRAQAATPAPRPVPPPPPPAAQLPPASSGSRVTQGPASAPAQQVRRLMGAELAQHLVGNTFEFDSPWHQRVRQYFVPDGRAFVRIPPAIAGHVREFDRGNWEVRDESFCVQWWQYMSGQRYCISLMYDGDTYFYMRDGVRREASIRRGDPYGVQR